jgi:hypothetical protein
MIGLNYLPVYCEGVDNDWDALLGGHVTKTFYKN